jgi:hypothetical protein
MGFLSFLILLVVVLLLAAGAMWVIRKWVPDPPAWAGTVVWGLAFFIIIVTLLQVTGVWDTIKAYDPKIPKL